MLVTLGNILRTVTGQGQNRFVTIVSTLAMVALLAPLQRGVQSFIDHWFYWRSYDGATTLAKFKQTLHDEVTIDTLKAHLVGVVNETLQPTKMGLWLREPDGEI